MSAKPFKRKKIIVNQHFQWRYTATVLFTVLVAVGVTALSVSWFHLFVGEKRLVCDSNGALVLTLLGVSAVLVLVLLVRTLLFTHSIAGPVHKVGLVLNRAANGEFDVEPLRFRRGDSFGELATAVNNCVGNLREVHECRALLSEQVADLHALFDEAEINREQLQSRLQQLRRTIDGEV